MLATPLRILFLIAPGAAIFFIGTCFIGYGVLNPYSSPVWPLLGFAAYFCLAAYIGGLVARACARAEVDLGLMREELAALHVLLDDTHDTVAQLPELAELHLYRTAESAISEDDAADQESISLCLVPSDLTSLMHGGTIDVYPISKQNVTVSLTVGVAQPQDTGAARASPGEPVAGPGVG